MDAHSNTDPLPLLQMHVNPAAAEATILSLCQSPQPYQECQFILGKLFDMCCKTLFFFLPINCLCKWFGLLNKEVNGLDIDTFKLSLWGM
jgi:hypothetical protein